MFFSLGLLLGKMGERGAPLVNVCQCINECVMKIINAAVWYGLNNDVKIYIYIRNAFLYLFRNNEEV